MTTLSDSKSFTSREIQRRDRSAVSDVIISVPAPRDSRTGVPMGREGDEVVKIIRPPASVTRGDWLFLIELAAKNFTLSGGLAEPTEAVLKALDVEDRISPRTWGRVFGTKPGQEIFREALAIRGVLPLGTSLTVQQSLALEVLGNPLEGPITKRLQKAGISRQQYQRWLEHKPFAEQLKLAAERNLNNAKPAVDIALTQQAIDGSLEAIKYFDKRTGRDPDKQQQLDSQKVLRVVIDALSKHLSAITRCRCGSEHDDRYCNAPDGPELFRRIAAEIEVRTKVGNEAQS